MQGPAYRTLNTVVLLGLFFPVVTTGRGSALPAATLRRCRWRLPLVWIVPLVTAVVAGSLVYNQRQEFGPTITTIWLDWLPKIPVPAAG